MTDRKVYGLGADGKLRTLQQRENGQMDTHEVSWEECLVHGNGFGMVVMIAGSTIEASTL